MANVLESGITKYASLPIATNYYDSFASHVSNRRPGPFSPWSGQSRPPERFCDPSFLVFAIVVVEFILSTFIFFLFLLGSLFPIRFVHLVLVDSGSSPPSPVPSRPEPATRAVSERDQALVDQEGALDSLGAQFDHFGGRGVVEVFEVAVGRFELPGESFEVSPPGRG